MNGMVATVVLPGNGRRNVAVALLPTLLRRSRSNVLESAALEARQLNKNGVRCRYWFQLFVMRARQPLGLTSKHYVGGTLTGQRGVWHRERTVVEVLALRHLNGASPARHHWF